MVRQLEKKSFLKQKGSLVSPVYNIRQTGAVIRVANMAYYDNDRIVNIGEPLTVGDVVRLGRGEVFTFLIPGGKCGELYMDSNGKITERMVANA